MQFKLRTLFVATAIIGVYCGLLFALPPTASLIALCILTTFLPPVIVGGIIYGRGAARAFWIGCATSGFVPFLIALYFGFALVMAGNGDDAPWYILTIAVCHALVAVHGLLVVGSRWIHSPRSPADTPQPLDSNYAVLHRRITLSDDYNSTDAVSSP